MLRSISVILACFMMITLCACSAAGQPASVPPSSPTASSEVSVATKPITLRLASTASGGDFTEIGTLTNFLGKEGILPKGSQVTQETISSGASSIGYLMEAGMADLGRGQNAVAGLRGMDGRPAYKEVRALFAAGSNGICAQVATEAFSKKSGYSTIEEVIENKYPATICTEDIGSSDYVLFSYVLEIHGITPKDFQAWGGKIIHTDNNTACEMLQDGQADMMLCATTLTSSMLTELSMTSNVTLNAFSDKVVSGLLERGFSERYIPAGTFNQFPQDARTAYIGTSLIVPSSMTDEVAYTLTKVLMEHRDQLSETCATMRNITPESAVNTGITVVPLHPGAIKYFQEIGALDASGNPVKK